MTFHLYFITQNESSIRFMKNIETIVCGRTCLATVVTTLSGVHLFMRKVNNTGRNPMSDVSIVEK